MNKQVVNGRLAETPDVKEVTLKDGSKGKVVTITIFANDPNGEVVEKNGKSYTKGIPLKCTAWGDNAEQIGKMKKGEVLTASTTLKANSFTVTNDETGETKQHSETVYVVKRIDSKNQIHKQLSDLLTGYERGDYDQIHERTVQPNFNKGQEKSAQKDVQKDADKAKESPNKE